MQTAAALLLFAASALTLSGQSVISATKDNYACKDRSILENASTIIKAGRRDGTLLKSAIVVNAFMEKFISERKCTTVRKGDRLIIEADVGDWWIEVHIPGRTGSWYVMRSSMSQ